MDKVRKTLLAVVPLLLAGLLAACGQAAVRLGWVETSSPDHLAASYIKYSGTETRTVPAQAGETLYLEYDAKVDTGDLRLEVEDPYGKTVWCVSLCEACGEIKALPVDQVGCYTISVQGNGTKGEFDIKWTKQ